jgi:hypothetical protein
MIVLLYDNYKATHTNPKISGRSNFQMMVDIFENTRTCRVVHVLGHNDPREIPDTDLYDLLCVNYYQAFMLAFDRPVLVCSRMDACGLNSRNYQYLDAANLVLVGKEYVYADRTKYTRRFFEGRYHSELILRAYQRPVPQVWQHRPSHRSRMEPHLGKLTPLSWNLLQYSFLHPRLQRLLYEPSCRKPIDVFFVCHPHERSPPLNLHRLDGFRKCRQICTKYGYRCVVGGLHPEEYHPTLKRAKVCISPYGLGSRIALEQYGLVTGTLVVKAAMGHVRTYPDIYTEEFMHFVRPDWVDLEAILVTLLDNYETEYARVARRRRDKVKKFNTRFYRSHIYGVFQQAVGYYVKKNEITRNKKQTNKKIQ